MRLTIFFALSFLFMIFIFPENTIAQKKKPSRKTFHASYYGDQFEGRNCASGDLYTQFDFTCANRTLPFNTIISVKNILNGKTVIVRVNDRGPFVRNRIVDVSKCAAQKLDLVLRGVAPVEITQMKLLDEIPLNDSLMNDGEIWDRHREKIKLSGKTLYLWETNHLKHALYMASSLAVDYGLKNICLKAAGTESARKYFLLVTDLTDNIEVATLRVLMKREGFFRTRIYSE